MWACGIISKLVLCLTLFSYFFWFCNYLMALVIYSTTLCIINLVMHFNAEKTKSCYNGEEYSFWKVIGMTLADYPSSLAVSLFTVLFSIFVCLLFGAHWLLVFKGWTTREWLSGHYKHLPIPPYSYGTCCRNFKKVVCCPKQEKSRISTTLLLQSDENKKQEFETHLQEIGGILPDQCDEVVPVLYKPPIEIGDI